MGRLRTGSYFKQFVEVKPEARLPSEVRLPVVIEAGSGIRLCGEFEGPFDPGVGKSNLPCTLHAMVEGAHLSYSVVVHGDPLMEAFLEQVESAAKEAKGAGALQGPGVARAT